MTVEDKQEFIRLNLFAGGYIFNPRWEIAGQVIKVGETVDAIFEIPNEPTKLMEFNFPLEYVYDNLEINTRANSPEGVWGGEIKITYIPPKGVRGYKTSRFAGAIAQILHILRKLEIKPRGFPYRIWKQ